MTEVSFKTFSDSFYFIPNFLTKLGVSSELKHAKLKISKAVIERCYGNRCSKICSLNS